MKFLWKNHELVTHLSILAKKDTNGLISLWLIKFKHMVCFPI